MTMERYTFTAKRSKGPGVTSFEGEIVAAHAEVLTQIESQCIAHGNGKWTVNIFEPGETTPCFVWKFAVPRPAVQSSLV